MEILTIERVYIVKILRIITLTIVCLLLTAFSLKAEDKPLPESQQKIDWGNLDKTRYKDFLEIKVFHKLLTKVFFMGENAKKIGLDANELTDYLKLKIKNNFANIRIEVPDSDKYTDKQVGFIDLRVWVVGDNYPIAYHLRLRFLHSDYSKCNNLIWDNEWLGFGSKDNVSELKKVIDGLIQELAILFFKVREEL